MAITVTSHDPGAGFGDWYTGHELGDALAALGLARSPTSSAKPMDGTNRIHRWRRSSSCSTPVTSGASRADSCRWPGSGTGRTAGSDRPWFDEYDLVFASSDRIVDMVARPECEGGVDCCRSRPTRPASAPPQRARRSPATCSSSGSNWSQHRDVDDALPALAARGYSVHVHGRGWDTVPGFEGLDRGYLPTTTSPAAYASARIVVDDAASSTKACGSVNSRVFDALAMGAVVVSNSVPGVHDLFDDSFPTWSDATSLVRLVETILGSPDVASARAAAYRTRVLKEHTYALRAATIRDALTAWASSTRYGIRIGVPSWDVVARWGDYPFARGLQRSLERSGHPARLHFLPDWGAPVAAREDVTIHLFGLKEARPRAGQVNLLWQISHPDLATLELYERHDHVFVASDAFAARFASRATVPVDGASPGDRPGAIQA